MSRYGGDPMRWLSQTPLAVVKAHAAMADQMDAEEALRMTTAAEIGQSARLSLDACKRQIRTWSKAASGRRRTVIHASPTAVAGLATGIGVRVVERKGKVNG